MDYVNLRGKKKNSSSTACLICKVHCSPDICLTQSMFTVQLKWFRAIVTYKNIQMSSLSKIHNCITWQTLSSSYSLHLYFS